MKLIKCQWCCEKDTKLNLTQKDGKYFHEKCLIGYDNMKVERKIESEQREEFINIIVQTHELISPMFITKRFLTYIASIKQKNNKVDFYLDIVRGYDYCKEKIIFARKNKQFVNTDGELHYCLHIVINYLSDARQNKELKKIQENTLVYSDAVKEMAKKYELDSPIEERLIIGLLAASQENIEINTQQKYTINGRNYRVDIIISITDKNKNIKQYVIECDGHDFHEKTKEQAARDKQRDRDFLSIGIPTIRFSGSEIWNNNKECVDEILSLTNS